MGPQLENSVTAAFGGKTRPCLQEGNSLEGPGYDWGTREAAGSAGPGIPHKWLSLVLQVTGVWKRFLLGVITSCSLGEWREGLGRPVGAGPWA